MRLRGATHHPLGGAAESAAGGAIAWSNAPRACGEQATTDAVAWSNESLSGRVQGEKREGGCRSWDWVVPGAHPEIAESLAHYCLYLGNGE